MLTKIFISVLLLTYVYTYMLKSIKGNNDTNFEKWPDNLNFESNEIKTLKQNAKFKPFVKFEEVFGHLFGDVLYIYIKFCNVKLSYRRWRN